MTLKELNIGESAVIETVGGQGALRQHFLDMGLIPGEKVTLVKFAPMGDPMELQIHGYALTLRLDDAARINVSPAKTVRVVPAARPEQKVVEHPGLGEPLSAAADRGVFNVMDNRSGKSFYFAVW